MNRRDGADLLLAGAVRLLPASRRHWGTAMRAELAGIRARQARWWFTAGCVRVVEIGDPYVAIMFLGWLIAAVQAVASVTLRQPVPGEMAASVARR